MATDETTLKIRMIDRIGIENFNRDCQSPNSIIHFRGTFDNASQDN